MKVGHNITIFCALNKVLLDLISIRSMNNSKFPVHKLQLTSQMTQKFIANTHKLPRNAHLQFPSVFISQLTPACPQKLILFGVILTLQSSFVLFFNILFRRS